MKALIELRKFKSVRFDADKMARGRHALYLRRSSSRMAKALATKGKWKLVRILDRS